MKPPKQPQDTQREIETTEYQEKLPFKSQPALTAWSDYVTGTNHSKEFFIERDEKLNNMFASVQRRVEVLEGRAASLRAMSIKAAMSGVRSQSPKESEYIKNDFTTPNGKTQEEVLLEDIHQSNTIKSSQLSPFMGDFGAKFFTRHNVVITTKFPHDQGILKAKKLFHQYCTSAEKASAASSHPKKIQTSARQRELKIMKLNKLEKRFETWMKCPLLTDRARQEFDKSCKELKAKGCIAFDYKKIQDKNKMMEEEISTLNPYENLEEKTMFNELFGSDIKKRLETFSKECRAVSQLCNRSEEDSCKNKDNFRKGVNIKRSKLKLLDDINKIKIRQHDPKEAAVQKKTIQEKKEIDCFAEKIKKGNEDMKNLLNAILIRRQKAQYNEGN